MNEKEELENFIDQLMGKKQIQTQGNDGWKEVNLNNKFSGMIPKTKEELMAFSMQQKANQSQQNHSAYKQAFIKEGYNVYRPVSNMQTNVDLAALFGNTSELSNKEFIVHYSKKFLIVEDYSQAIDLSKLENQKF